MGKKRFYLFKRGKRGIFYASLIDPATGEILNAKSTGETDRDAALITATEWLKTGVPTGRQNEKKRLADLAGVQTILRLCRTESLTPDDAESIAAALRLRGLLDAVPKKPPIKLIEFLENFWDSEKSPYIRDKLAHGQKFSRQYLITQRSAISAWNDFFGVDKTLESLTRQDLRDFGKALFEKGVPSGTIQNKLIAGTIPLGWAEREGIIPSNPAKGITRYSGGKTKRDCLTDSEMTKLFAAEWEDKRCYVAALIAATAALRSGEVRALRKEDIKDTCLEVKHSFSNWEGLKCPKNHEARLAPLYPEVRAAILDLLAENPHSDLDNPFIFYSEREDKPLGGDVFVRHLRRAMKQAGIDPAGRRIDFHSLRHFQAFKLTMEKDIGAAQIVLGHKTKAMTEHYADHQSRELMERLVKERDGAGNIVKFEKTG